MMPYSPRAHLAALCTLDLLNLGLVALESRVPDCCTVVQLGPDQALIYNFPIFKGGAPKVAVNKAEALVSLVYD